MNSDIFTTTCMGYSLFTGNLSLLPALDKVVINTINQYSYCIAEKDVDFKNSLIESDVLLPDGIGIVAASKFLNQQHIAKIAGADLHDYLLRKLEISGGKCFYLGSSDETLRKIKVRLKNDFPSIQVASFSPPYKPQFSQEDNALMLAEVNAFKPDVLFIGMTAPKQEKWAHAHKALLDANIICSIGAVFDFYAGTVKRPGKFWINSNLEWLGRLFNEPRRMWKRYIYYGFVFGYYLLKEKVRSWRPLKTNTNSTLKSI
ncbi:WecB/TagA/CpsF family glycosyltransferase [Pontibacter sp. CAU 1760]